MNPRTWFVCGAVLAGLAVVNGAFAAHGLEKRLATMHEDNDDGPQLIEKRLKDYDTGVRYQMYHAIGLMFLGIVATRKATPLWALAGFGFLAGTMIFSGLLYMLVLFEQPKLGATVPIGGVAFIVGWIALAVGAATALREPAQSPTGA